MNPKTDPWFPTERISALIQMEPALVMLALALGSYLVYRFFLRGVNASRHENLKALFRNLLFHTVGFGSLFGFYEVLITMERNRLFERATNYVGLAVLIWGCVVFVKTSRIILFEYLFVSHMRVGVPVLLVNLFTLLLSIVLGGWIFSEVFAVKLTPILATSAVLSLVLGLAVQDTLGNLFAGVALQFDKPYEIGDWIEIQSSGQKWVGQVHEITWRATVLIAFGEELITVPNRTVSSSQILNYSVKGRPIIRRQVFRIPVDADVTAVKKALLKGVSRVAAIRSIPSPICLVGDTEESWLPVRVIFYLDDFGIQYLIADQVITNCLEELKKIHVRVATPKMEVSYERERNLPPAPDAMS